jgi:hypothetical protein
VTRNTLLIDAGIAALLAALLLILAPGLAVVAVVAIVVVVVCSVSYMVQAPWGRPRRGRSRRRSTWRGPREG